MNQDNAYSKGCEAKYLLKSKTSVDLVEKKKKKKIKKKKKNALLMLQPRERFSPDPFNFFFARVLEFYIILFQRFKVKKKYFTALNCSIID